MTGRERSSQHALARALYGAGPDRGRVITSAPDEWELVVAAVELALLGGRFETPPARLRALPRWLPPPAPDPGIVTP